MGFNFFNFQEGIFNNTFFLLGLIPLNVKIFSTEYKKDLFSLLQQNTNLLSFSIFNKTYLALHFFLLRAVLN